MKKYIGLTIKRYIPFLIVGLIISFFIVSATASTIPTSVTVYNNNLSFLEGEIGASIVTYLIVAAIPMVLLTIIGPIFANSYRNSLESADLFYQYGKDKRHIRYANNGVILGMVLAILIVVYSGSLFMIIFRQLPNIGREPEIITEYYSTRTTYFLVYNFLGIVLVHLIYLVLAIFNYAISYFLITRSNNAINSIITLILGHTILFLGLETPFLYGSLFEFTNDANVTVNLIIEIYNPYFLAPTKSASLVGLVGWINYIFPDLIGGTNTFLPLFAEMQTEKIFSLVLSILAVVIYLGFGAISIVSFFKEKESSGEHSGRALGRDKWQYVIFHIGFGLIGLWYATFYLILRITSLIFITYFLLFLGMASFGAIYYVFLSLLRRTFRINKKGLFIILGSVLTNLLSTIILLTVLSS